MDIKPTKREDYLITGLSEYERFDFDAFFDKYELKTHGGVIVNREFRSALTIVPKNKEEREGAPLSIAMLIVKGVDRDSVDAEACINDFPFTKDTIDTSKLRVNFRSYGFQLVVDEDKFTGEDKIKLKNDSVVAFLRPSQEVTKNPYAKLVSVEEDAYIIPSSK